MYGIISELDKETETEIRDMRREQHDNPSREKNMKRRRERAQEGYLTRWKELCGLKVGRDRKCESTRQERGR